MNIYMCFAKTFGFPASRVAFVSLLRCIECKIESLEGPPSHPVLPCFTVHRLLVACTHVYVTKCTTLLHCTSTPASISLYLAMHLRRSHWYSSILHPEQREIWNWIERHTVLRCACVILHIWFRKYWQTPDVHIFNDSRLMLINWFWWLIELVAINRVGIATVLSIFEICNDRALWEHLLPPHTQ